MVLHLLKAHASRAEMFAPGLLGVLSREPRQLVPSMDRAAIGALRTVSAGSVSDAETCMPYPGYLLPYRIVGVDWDMLLLVRMRPIKSLAMLSRLKLMRRSPSMPTLADISCRFVVNWTI